MKLLLLTFQKDFILVGGTSQKRTEISAETGREKQNGKYMKDGERKFQDFYLTDIKTYKIFYGMVFGVGSKGIPSECALKVRSYSL